MRIRHLGAAVLLGWAVASRANGACASCPKASFGPASQVIPGLQGAQWLAAADFDGDGIPDLVVGSPTAVLLGRPDGGYAPPSFLASVFNARLAVPTDFDQDGRMDVIVMGQDAVDVLLGNGDGTFQPALQLPLPAQDPYPNFLSVGDLNGDGLPDVLVTTNGGVLVFLNGRNGAFTALPPALGLVYGQTELGDFNGDGKLDVVIDGYGGGLFLGNGDGTFASPPLPVPVSGNNLAADFNRDGKLDLVSLSGGSVSLAFGHGDGTFDAPMVLASAGSASWNNRSSIAAADMNRDGWLDVVVATYPLDVLVIRSNGGGGFLPALAYTMTSSPSGVLVADLDRDGTQDVAVSPGEIFHGLPDGTLEPVRHPANGTAIAAADFDQDGKMDLANGGLGLTVWKGDGNGGFTTGYTNAGPTRIRSIAVGDLNHDGHLDIAAAEWGPSFFPSDGALWIFLGDGLGGFTSLAPVPLDYLPWSVAIAPLDGDLYPEVLVSGNGGTRIYLGNGDGTFSPGVTLPGTFSKMVLRDLNGDSKLDLIGGTSGGNRVVVFLGNGDGTFGPESDNLTGYSTDDLVVADFDGDGKLDIVTSGMSFLRGNGDGTFQLSLTFPYGIGGNLAALDFDGDGIVDLAVYDESVILMKGNGDGTFSRSGTYGPGTPPLYGSAGIVSADWNGDGKPDLAVAVSGTLAVLLNTNCTARRATFATPPSSCNPPTGPFTIQPVVDVLDDGGNLVHCAAGSVTASIVPGTGNPAGTLTGGITAPLVSGAASFTDLGMSAAGNGYELQFTPTSGKPVRTGRVSFRASVPFGITGPSSICSTSPADYSADAGLDGYLWTVDGVKVGGGRTLRLVGLSVGTHTLAVVGDHFGCDFSASMPIEVGQAAPLVSNGGSACVGDTIQLTASSVAGGAYTWTGPNGFTSSAQNPTIPSATLAAAGLYAVTVNVNGCISAPATTTVAVHSVPFRPLAHNDGPHCAGQALQLSASNVANATYAWTGPNGFTSSLQNPTIPSATTADSGVYSVTVTVDGCVSPPASTSVVIAACQQLPVSLSADASGNGILEPGEMISLAPSWMNTTGSPTSVTGTASAFTGPAGATYSLSDATADYGTVAAGATSSCVSTGDCYAVGVSAPATRPLLHWDAAFSESLSTGDAKTWSLHIGGSFSDVPTALPFYRFVETLLHNGVTTGCGGGGYCPASTVTRAQMAVFLLVSQAGAGYVPPPATGLFADVPVTSPFAPWIEELSRRGVTAGCGSGNYCPQSNVTRAQMAVFLLVTREGAGYAPPAPIGVFADVPAGNPFAPWIEELFHRGIAGGCGAGNYCPGNPVSRGQMAVLLTATFGLSLGGP